MIKFPNLWKSVLILLGSLMAMFTVFVLAVRAFRPKHRIHTVVMHVAEKSFTHIPDPKHVYNQIKDLNPKNLVILLLPEYFGHISFEDTIEFLKRFNNTFSRIPLMFDIFAGGTHPTPIMKLTPEQIETALDVANIKMLRMHELMSFYLDKTIPTEYIEDILSFCRDRKLKLFWSEWNIDTFPLIRELITEYEDIVTVAFGTNSIQVEPRNGYSIASSSMHWGASVQSWYWYERQNRKPDSEREMPLSLMVEHTKTAYDMGAEIIQFEPYWYFFNNGEALESLEAIMEALT